MSKLKKEDKFFDISDYGRPVAKRIAIRLQPTIITPIHVTLLFGVSGVFALVSLYLGLYILVAIFLVIKSILDAADGELARVKNTPSYTGRYLDSIFDIILNFILIFSIGFLFKSHILLTCLAFICIQMQGTLYNYYYVILRNKSIGGDNTSKIFEYKEPIAFEGESQKMVHITYFIFNILYSFFDKTIHLMDANAYKASKLPNWFMSLVSIYGLGFQLVLIGLMLILNFGNFIIPFFIGYSIFIFVFIGIRKMWLN